MNADGPMSEADALNAEFGKAYSDGRMDDCKDLLRREIALRARGKDLLGEANAFHNLGNVYNRIGDLGNSVESYQRVVQLAQVTGNNEWQVKGLTNLGNTLVRLRRETKATEVLSRAVEFQKILGDELGRARNEKTLGLLALQRGEPTRARVHLEIALSCLQTSCDDHTRAMVLLYAGIASVQLGDAYAAKDHLAKAEPLLRTTGHTEEARLARKKLAELNAQKRDVRDVQ